MAHPSEAVARRIRELAAKSNRNLDFETVQQLVYLAHAEHLAQTGEPLVAEGFRAGPDGPLLPDLHRRFLEGQDPLPATDVPVESTTEPLELGALNSIDGVWARYQDWSASDLARLIHGPGTPWARTWEEAGEDAAITNELIRRHRHGK